MKIVLIIFMLFTLNYIYSSEFVKSDFRFYSTDADTDTTASASNDGLTSASDSTYLQGVFAVNIVHAVLGGVAYAGMIADCILGNIILYKLYNPVSEESDESDSSTSASTSTTKKSSDDSDSSTGATQNLQLAHRYLSISTYALMGSAMIMSFITLGIKIKNHVPINQFHFISSIITAALYILEIPFIALTAYSYNTHGAYTKEISLAHGIYSYILLASFTITLISIPIGTGHRKVLF